MAALDALRIARLGDRDEIGEKVDLLGDTRAPAIDDVDELLEVEKPERQAQRPRADHLRLVLERRRIFVVRIDQQDARRLRRLEDTVEKQHHRARLAAAGGAEHGEVLLQKVLHADRRRDGFILAERPDGDRLRASVVVYGLQFRWMHLMRDRTDRRVGADTAVEARSAVDTGTDLALQLDTCQHGVRKARRRLCRIDEPDDDGAARFDRKQLADGKRIAGLISRLVAVDRDDGARAADRDDAAERLRRLPQRLREDIFSAAADRELTWLHSMPPARQEDAIAAPPIVEATRSLRAWFLAVSLSRPWLKDRLSGNS